MNADETRLLVEPFPMPDTLELRAAFRQLHLAGEGTEDQKRSIGDPCGLPRPWEPGTCNKPALRAELWAWLDQVVTWHNHQYAWDVERVIPACWPHHPHLVHDLAVLADQRRRAQLAVTSDLLEEWHRYTLPAFHDRMKAQVRAHCDGQHQPWPARARVVRCTADASHQSRWGAFRGDLISHQTRAPAGGRNRGHGLGDLDTEGIDSE